MVSMLQASLRAPVTRLITPMCRGLLKLGLSANGMSAIGALGAAITAIYFFGNGKFFIGFFITLAFVLSDLFDGTMARLSESGGSKWGALLDSTLDRITDATLLGAVAYFLYDSHDQLFVVVLVAMVAGGLVSYIKARAESLEIPCNGGLAERTERLIIAFLAIFLQSVHVSFALAIGMWILAIVSVYTVGERLIIVYRATLLRANK